jgi:phage virion morphogenesis protein
VDHDLSRLEQWAGALLARMEPGARRALARRIAIELRRSQARRIAEQRNPDGSAFEPRKSAGRETGRRKPGRLKRRRQAMFLRLRTARFMRLEADAAVAGVRFVGRAARIARVHQYGERDRVSPKGPEVRYPARRLLGFSGQDIERIRDLLLEHLRG